MHDYFLSVNLPSFGIAINVTTCKRVSMLTIAELSRRTTFKPMLETKRLIMRRITLDDAEGLYHIYRETEVLQYFTQGQADSIAAEQTDLERHLDGPR